MSTFEENFVKYAKVHPDTAFNNVLADTTQNLPEDTPKVTGYKWDNTLDYDKILDSYSNAGFQATNFGKAVKEINRMLSSRSIPLETNDCNPDPFIRKKTNCTIFLGYTSNMISSGIREKIHFLVKNGLVDCIVTTAGGIEEDIMKCFAPTYVGDFHLKGKVLKSQGINRTGNLLVPNTNYRIFGEWFLLFLDEILKEQNEKKENWTPSKIIARMGERIDHEDSVYYWAWRNKIPVFCPALTDGSIGDLMFFHSFKKPGLKLDILEDLKRLTYMSLAAEKTGIIILGGGLVKHHICNANAMRKGADFAVYVNTGAEFDGSDSGASPDEAVSWGKIKPDASPIKLCTDATLVFPLLVAKTFAKYCKN